MKSGKQRMRDGIELPSQERVRTLGEIETYDDLRILKTDTIKETEMKEKKKLKKRISDEVENFMKPRFAAVTWEYWKQTQLNMWKWKKKKRERENYSKSNS